MKEFYSVEFDNRDVVYFKDRTKALEFLWQEYINSLYGDESDEEIDVARNELNIYDEILGFGGVYTECFKD